jgi:hypothetical protein
MYMETSRGNSLCSYPKQIKVSFYSFTKSGNRKAEQVLFGGLISVRGRKMWGKELER